MSTPTTTDLAALLNELAAARATDAEQLGALWAMTPDQRRAAYTRGDLTLVQLRAWATHASHELPATAITRRGELPWITRHTPEYLED